MLAGRATGTGRHQIEHLDFHLPLVLGKNSFQKFSLYWVLKNCMIRSNTFAGASTWKM